MDYLTLCNEVNDVLGLQGSITDVSSPSGLHKYIVRATKNAWIDIQNKREDWTFMIGENSSFSTIADQIEYTPAQVFGSASAAEDLSTWKTRKAIFLEFRPLSYVPYEDVPFIDNTIGNRPRWYSFNPGNQNLIIDKPNQAYSLVIRYNRANQVLAVQDDEPTRISSNYHNAIVYVAVKKVIPYVGHVNLDTQYMEEAKRSLGELMRKYVNRSTVDVEGIA